MATELHIWYKSSGNNDADALKRFGQRWARDLAGTENEIEFEVVETPDGDGPYSEGEALLYHWCEWCKPDDSPKFDNTEDYEDHLRRVHPDEAW